MSPDKLDLEVASQIGQLAISDTVSLPNIVLGAGVLLLGITLIVLYFKKKRKDDL